MAKITAPQFTVGQEVILRERLNSGHRDYPVTITRVGRKYVYVDQYSREAAFDAEDGIQKGDNYYGARIFTPESLAEHDRRVVARARLNKVTRSFSWVDRLSTDDIERVLAIIDPQPEV